MKKMLLLMIVLLCVGCTHNLTKLNDEGVYARTTEAQLASMDADGNMKAAYHGIGATQLMQDPCGNWTNMPGPIAVLSVPIPSGGMAYILSPKDTKIARMTYTPNPNAGEPAILVEGLEANISEPITQQTAALAICLPILRDMVKEEALATIEKWKVAQAITPTIADLLIQLVTTAATW